MQQQVYFHTCDVKLAPGPVHLESPYPRQPAMIHAHKHHLDFHPCTFNSILGVICPVCLVQCTPLSNLISHLGLVAHSAHTVHTLPTSFLFWRVQCMPVCMCTLCVYAPCSTPCTDMAHALISVLCACTILRPVLLCEQRRPSTWHWTRSHGTMLIIHCSIALCV